MIQKADDQILGDILEKNDKVLIKFHADWCGVCKAFAPQFKKLAEENSAQILYYEINAPENPKARIMAGVYSLPYFASFEKGELKHKVASSNPNEILRMIKELEKESSISE
ncbi:thioredoxin family protein [Marivirga sp. S37H4]|uniref:Thioredoxin family protein n=1 Tax=Marivirga aurantiaca TaxID=2802615 RepID=A0A935C9D5_9BACT|nr:thioredoxin family protein [Marivirga aurantiaca]MBK6264193.1 thioredoxin family protein [Marivirga aurantiaca]